MLTAEQRVALDHLPGTDGLLIRRLVKGRRLKFGQSALEPDVIDELSTRLVSKVLTERQRLLLVLPDSRPHRPALLLTIALLRDWLNTRNAVSIGLRDEWHVREVIYSGAHVGIREQLAQVGIEGLNLSLSDVFRQRDLGRQGSVRARPQSLRPHGQSGSALPELVTLYAPIDPESIIAGIQPRWLAIDCEDAPRLPWLGQLLAAAKARDLPVIAWSQNPLSECVADFARVGQIVVWPPSNHGWRSVYDSANHDTAGTPVQALIATSVDADDVSVTLREATHTLAAAGPRTSSRLLRDAVALHWRFLRAVESLAVPLDFFEAEAPDFWGLKTFAQYSEACQRFRDACLPLDATLAASLESAGASIQHALDTYRKIDPPLWDALCRLIVEDLPSDAVRLITFPGRARKQLFLLALLARYNITEADLQSLRTWVVIPEELHRLQLRRDGLIDDRFETDEPPMAACWHPVLVGLPSPYSTPNLLPVLRQRSVDVLIFPHQAATLRRRVGEWNECLGSNAATVTQVLAALGAPPPLNTPARADEYLELAEPRPVEVGGARRVSPWKPLQQLMALDDSATELAYLFDGVERDGDDERIVYDVLTAPRASALGPNAAPTITDTAVVVEFAEGWRTQLALDQTIQVIVFGSTGFALDERFVRAVRPGDRVLFIQGQARQNLYDLILSRVHHHPAIELHLALIRRWQTDAAFAYRRWRLWGVRNQETLLELLRARGSAVTSSLTIAQWLRGVTLCPQDPEDLRRLAEELDMSFVRTHYRRIERAASRLRGLHRGLSNRLNRWLEGQVNGIATRDANDVIDGELGLTFDDIRDSLLVLRVSAVQQVVGPFLSDAFGQLEKMG